MNLNGKFFKILILLFIFSCNEKIEKKNKTKLFLERIEQLKEFKKAENKIDSLNKSGIKSEISIELVQNSMFAPDSLKHTYTAIISQDLGFATNIIFTVRYDKNTFKIISIETNK